MRRFEKKPPLSEMDKGRAAHASYTHGYMIAEVESILEKRGIFEEITTDRRLNRLTLDDGTMVISSVSANVLVKRFQGEN